uniref:Uncharacterized protein n=1 Tax=Timema bartmani TaxID=61472 RepID=A0A7R9ERM3_9NEOP|nr:unnamed protein product [Timema bartmani]
MFFMSSIGNNKFYAINYSGNHYLSVEENQIGYLYDGGDDDDDDDDGDDDNANDESWLFPGVAAGSRTCHRIFPHAVQGMQHTSWATGTLAATTTITNITTHPAGNQLARPCSKLVGFGPGQSPVSRLHLTWFPLGFNPTSARLLRPRGTPLGGDIQINVFMSLLIRIEIQHEGEMHAHQCMELFRIFSTEPVRQARIICFFHHMFCYLTVKTILKKDHINISMILKKSKQGPLQQRHPIAKHLPREGPRNSLGEVPQNPFLVIVSEVRSVIESSLFKRLGQQPFLVLFGLLLPALSIKDVIYRHLNQWSRSKHFKLNKTIWKCTHNLTQQDHVLPSDNEDSSRDISILTPHVDPLNDHIVSIVIRPTCVRCCEVLCQQRSKYCDLSSTRKRDEIEPPARYLKEMYQQLRGGRVENNFGKNLLSTPNRDSNLYLPVISGLVDWERSALDHTATEVDTHRWERELNVKPVDSVLLLIGILWFESHQSVLRCSLPVVRNRAEPHHCLASDHNPRTLASVKRSAAITVSNNGTFHANPASPS